MSRLFILLALLVNTTVFAQDSISSQTSADSTPRYSSYEAYQDSMRAEDERRRMQQNNEWFARYQQEQRAKKKKQAIIYIAVGVAMLGVLIVGLRRRTRKK